MKFIIALLVISLLILVGCDRFEHNFEIVDDTLPVTPFFLQFATVLENVTVSTLPEVMSYYDDDYSNNGLVKDDIEVLYNSFIEDELTISATLTDTTDLPNITWQLTAENNSREVVYDEEIADVLVTKEESYIFFGDQADKPNVVVELFTGTWCTYCPFAEEALHNLKQQYGSRLSYVEYHIGDPLDSGFSVLLNYYPNQGTLPITIINGNAAIITGADEDSQAQFEAILEPLLDEPLTAGLSDASAEVNENVLTGSVSIDLVETVSLEDLKLVLILQEDTNTDYTNYHGDDLFNVAIKRSVIDITASSQVIDFSMTDLDVLASGYDSLPEDLTLLIWVQKLESSYDQATCKSYNVIEIPVVQTNKN